MFNLNVPCHNTYPQTRVLRLELHMALPTPKHSSDVIRLGYFCHAFPQTSFKDRSYSLAIWELFLICVSKLCEVTGLLERIKTKSVITFTSSSDMVEICISVPIIEDLS